MTQKRKEPVKKTNTQRPSGRSGKTPPAAQKRRRGLPPDHFADRENPMHRDSYSDQGHPANQDVFSDRGLPSNGEPVSDRDSRKSNISSIHRSEHIRVIQRKRALTSALFLGIVVILVMVVTAAAILYVTDYVRVKPHYSFITMGTIEHSVGATALIVRDEQTFVATTSGSLVALATEGSRVAKSQKLAMIIPAGMEDTSASLRNVQIQIVELQRELMAEGKGSGSEAICLEANTEILPIINMIRADSISDNSSNLMSYSSSIQVLMDRRDADLQMIDFQDEELSALISTKKDLENALSSQSVSLVAEIPGIVSYKLDGMENALNSTLITSILPEQCAEYISSSKSFIPEDLNIEANEPVLRICQNAEQYLATLVTGVSAADFPLDSVMSIRLPSEGIVIEDCKVIRSVQNKEGAFVVFQTTSQVERLLDRRTAEIEIIMSETAPGLRVPVSSLISADFDTGYAKIMYNSSGYARILTVTVLDHDREYALISPLEGFDLPNSSTIIITNPKTISEGDKVEQ